MKAKKKKRWNQKEEIELDHLYSSWHLTLKELAKRFNCTVKEIRIKIKAMGIEQ